MNDLKWGEKKWFDNHYIDSSSNFKDSWEISSRGSQTVRINNIISIITKFSKSFDEFIDIGSGLGIFLERLKQKVKINHTYSTDISKEACKALILKKITNYSEVSALPNIPFDGKRFDLVTANEVIYYLNNKNRKKAVHQLINSTKKGGLLCISGSISTNGNYFSLNEIEKYLPKNIKILSKKFHYLNLYYPIENFFYKIKRISSQTRFIITKNKKYKIYKKGRFFKKDYLPLISIFIYPITKLIIILLYPFIYTSFTAYFISFISKLFLFKKSISGVIYILKKKS